MSVAIVSANYDCTSNTLVVVGSDFVAQAGASNDVDLTKLTFTGEGGGTYSLVGSPVEIDSASQFTVLLAGNDLYNVERLLNKNGFNAATGGTPFNLAFADNWLTGATPADDLTDASNPVTVFNYTVPTIDSATYDWNTGILAVTGSNFVNAIGPANDVDAGAFTLTGDGGATYTLTDTADVELLSATAFSLALSVTDRSHLNGLLNKNGSSADSGTLYNVAAADNWLIGAPAGNAIGDALGNPATVANYAAPTVSSASYDCVAHTLQVAGSGFVARSGTANDIDLTKLTLTGAGGDSYTLTGTSGAELDSTSQFTVTLSGSDIYNIERLLNANGVSASDATPYNLALADDWLTKANATLDIGDSATAVTVTQFALPSIAGASYDWGSGTLTVSGSHFVNANGPANDVDATRFTLTGQGGSYTLTDTAAVELTSASQFVLTLSADDQAHVRGVLNKAGTQSSDATIYNLAAAEDWMAGAPASATIADPAGNAITASHLLAPTLTRAAYDQSSGQLTVTGNHLFHRIGASNDIALNALTLTGGNGDSYTLTSTSQVDIDSATEFTVTLSGSDKTQVDLRVDQAGLQSSSGTVYNLAAANGWLAAADAAQDMTDIATPLTATVDTATITSATYNASTGVLVVSGTHMQAKGTGADADIDAAKFTFIGEGGATYTLTDTADVEIASSSGFTLILSAADLERVNRILNKNGIRATDDTPFALSAADDWNTQVTLGNITDLNNSITVTAVALPTVTDATYDATAGTLVVGGTGFLQAAGANNDIDASLLTLTGEGVATYTLTDTADADITDSSRFTLTLSAADRIAVQQLLNKNGSASTGATPYNLAAAEDWNRGADATATIADAANALTVSGVGVPAITAAAYDATTGTLLVSAVGLLPKAGSGNDIVATRLTLSGEGGASYTLTDTANVDIAGSGSFTLILSATDQAAVAPLLNRNGTTSTGGTPFNLAAAEDWNVGADATATLADATNAVTVSGVAVPTITGASYDVASGELVVTAASMQAKAVGSDIDASKITFVGEGGVAYTLTDTADVDIASSTGFTLTLSPSDRAAIQQLFNKNGSASTSGSLYNLMAGEDWNSGADPTADIADATSALTVSGVSEPLIVDATYDATAGTLVVSGTGFLQAAGANNDIDASLLTLTGEGAATYTLTDTADADITDSSRFTLTLSAADQIAVQQLLNKNGSASTGATPYNLSAAEDWNRGADATATIADAANVLTVSGVGVPAITGAAYDATTGTLLVSAVGLLPKAGSGNDIVATRITLSGEGGASYTLTDTANVDIAGSGSFTLILSATDQAAVAPLLNRNGTTSTGGTPFNLAAAEDWNVGADATATLADATNAVTVSGVAVPTITGASYDVASGELIVSGSGFLQKTGTNNDIDASMLSVTGEGTVTHTLTDTADVEITSSTSFTLTLSTADRNAVQPIFNKTGTESADKTPYNLKAAEDWNSGADATTLIADPTNALTIANVAIPIIDSATYDAATGILTLKGSGFLSQAGANNDIAAALFTFTGEGGTSVTLAKTSDVDIASSTLATLTVSSGDQVALRQLLNKNGSASTGATPYNLAAAEDWNRGADATATIADAANVLTVSGVGVPAITGAAYDATTGTLLVSAVGLLPKAGSGNDIVATRLTLSGEGGASYTLTDTANVDIAGSGSFTLILSATDQAAVAPLLNRNGTTSTGGTPFNLAAAEDWNVGADATATLADATNAVTVSGVAVPTIASASYDAASGVLTVTGAGLLLRAGAHNDIDASTLMFVGEGGASYVLTDTPDADIDNGSGATLVLSAIDRAAVGQILNKNGTASTGASAYNLVAAEDWNTGAEATTTIADAVNPVTVAHVATPTLVNAIYDTASGTLILNGSGFLQRAGANNDIRASLLTFTGEGDATHSLSGTANVDIASDSRATLLLDSTDQAALRRIFNKTGMLSSSGTLYNLAAAEDWAAGADAAIDVADLTDNGVWVQLNQAPLIVSNGGSTAIALAVSENSMIVTRVTAEDANANQTPTYTIVGGDDQARFAIEAATGILRFLVAPDYEQPTDSDGDNAYVVKVMADDGYGGSDVQTLTVEVANVLEATEIAGDSSIPAGTFDGVPLVGETVTSSTGRLITTITVDPLTHLWQNDADSALATHAELPLAVDDDGGFLLQAALPQGVGLINRILTAPTLALDKLLIEAAAPLVVNNTSFAQRLQQSIDDYVAGVANTQPVSLRTVALTVPANTLWPPVQPILFEGIDTTDSLDATRQPLEALIIDARSVPAGTAIELDAVEFAVVFGASRISGGDGRNYVVGDDASQYLVLGADDDVLRGNGGDDTVASRAGNDRLVGDSGNDLLVGGSGDDRLEGGDGNDTLQGGSSDKGAWSLALGNDGLMHLCFVAADPELSAVAARDSIGYWSVPVDQRGQIDSHFAVVEHPYARLSEIALLYHAVVGALPDMSMLEALASLPDSTAELAQLAYDYYRDRSGLLLLKPLDVQVRALIQQVLGSATDADTLAGVAYIGQGGSWSELLTRLAFDNQSRNLLLDSQGRLGLTAPQSYGEMGWSTDAGNNTLIGGNGNDWLVASRAGSNALDGGDGLDLVSIGGTIEQCLVGLQANVGGGIDLVIQNPSTQSFNIVSAIELLQIGREFYRAKEALPELLPGELKALGDFVEMVGTQELQLMGVPSAWL